MSKTFNVALTADFFDEGQPRYPDFDLGVLRETPGIVCRSFDSHLPEIAPEQIGNAAGVIVLSPKVTKASLAASEQLLAIGRFGVGYDSVDVAACTSADVMLFITSGAVDRPVAEATVGWMIALSHNMLVKDRLVREGRWDERSGYMGSELRDRTLGVVGFGGIGASLIGLLSGFGMKPPLVYDPYVDPATVARCGAQNVSLDDLLSQADFVSLHCPLNEETTNLISERELARMKPTAYLINTARGGIVDEAALYCSLAERRIAGAAIDCFVGEPIEGPHRFGELDNVILAPHCIAWTAELFRDIGQKACQGMINLAQGTLPAGGVVNPEVLDRKSFHEKWQRLRLAEP